VDGFIRNFRYESVTNKMVQIENRRLRQSKWQLFESGGVCSAGFGLFMLGGNMDLDDLAVSAMGPLCAYVSKSRPARVLDSPNADTRCTGPSLKDDAFICIRGDKRGEISAGSQGQISQSSSRPNARTRAEIGKTISLRY